MRQQNVCSQTQLLFFTIQPSEHVVFITLESIRLFSKFFLLTVLSKALLFFTTHTCTHYLKKWMSLTGTKAQILSRVLLTLLMLTLRGIEAWLPTTGRPQGLHRHSLITIKFSLGYPNHSSSYYYSSSAFSSSSYSIPTFGFSPASFHPLLLLFCSFEYSFFLYFFYVCLINPHLFTSNT